MKWILSIFVALNLAVTPAIAQSFDWGAVNLPVRPTDWNAMPEDGRIGYASGATQIGAYLSKSDGSQTKCVAGLLSPFLTETVNQTGTSPLLFTGQAPSGSLLSSYRISEVFADTNDSHGWIGFVLGVSDYLHFRLFDVRGEAAADCVKGKILVYIAENPKDASSWTETPEEPFVQNIIPAALKACNVS